MEDLSVEKNRDVRRGAAPVTAMFLSHQMEKDKMRAGKIAAVAGTTGSVVLILSLS